MIHIKIYGKGRDKTHIYATCRCSGQQMTAQLSALLVATCQIARGAMTKPDKDAFLLAMSAAWDAQEGSNGNE